MAQAVEIALRENPSLSAAQSQVEIAEQRIVQGRAGFLPRLTVSEGFQRTNNPPQVFSSKLNQESFTAADFEIDRLNQPNAQSDFATSFTAVWPLYDGGRSWHEWQQAKLGKEAAGQAHEGARQSVVARVMVAYAGTLLARENLAVIESASAAARLHLSMAAARYESGLTVKSDFLRAQVRLAELEQQKIMAEGQIEVARSALNAAMGVEDAWRFELTDRLAPAGAPEGTVESWLATAQRRRLDLKEFEAREAMAREAIGKARAGHLPSLELIGNYRIHTEEFDQSAESYAVGAAVSMNLFSGLETSARVAEARAALRQVQALRRQMQNQAALEVRQAHTLAVSSFQRIEVARQAVDQAEESLRIVANRYAGGLLTIVDLLTAEASLQQLNQTLAQARHDYAVGETRLRLAAGVLAEK